VTLFNSHFFTTHTVLQVLLTKIQQCNTTADNYCCYESCAAASSDTVGCGVLCHPVICCLTLNRCYWRDLYCVMQPTYRRLPLLIYLWICHLLEVCLVAS